MLSKVWNSRVRKLTTANDRPLSYIGTVQIHFLGPPPLSNDHSHSPGTDESVRLFAEKSLVKSFRKWVRIVCGPWNPSSFELMIL